MSVVLGSYVFPDAIRVREEHEELGGRDGRVVLIEGVVEGSSATVVVGVLAAVMAAASEVEEGVLQLRPGRGLLVRRRGFVREVAADGRTGSFVLRLEARDPFEFSLADTTVNWSVVSSGDTQELSTSGNVWAPLLFTVAAVGDLVEPTFSDGIRTMVYEGIVGDGQVLVLDGALGMATLDGADVTAYTGGDFLRVLPGGTTVTFSDDAGSSHSVSVVVSFADRWW